MSTCPHGRDHAALKRDPIAWLRIAYVGRQFTPADDLGPAETLESRNCSCLGTLSILVDEDTFTPAMALEALGLDWVDVHVRRIEVLESIADQTAELLAELGAADDELFARAA